MTNEEMISSIADGTMSISRIRRIVQAAYGVELTSTEIETVTRRLEIATPHRVPSGNSLLDAYPDKWSFLLTALSFWVRVRRYWGDEKALELKQNIESATAPGWRALFMQFDNYIHPQIYNRLHIGFRGNDLVKPLPLEAFYSWEMQRNFYLQAYDREMAAHPEPNPGAKFPLATPDYEMDKLRRLEESYLAAFENTFRDGHALSDYFVKFWQTVQEKRGADYAENLRQQIVAPVDAPLGYRPFYSQSKGNFRHFLRHLRGFQTNAPYRVIIKIPPSVPLQEIELEGALVKYGWEKVHSIAMLGTLVLSA